MPYHPSNVALEIGTTNVRALVGEIREDHHVVVTGVGVARSDGVRKGQIVSVEAAVEPVRDALRQAAEQSDVAIRTVYLAVTGGHIRGDINRGTIHVMNPEGAITEAEVRSVAQVAKSISLPQGREVMHTIWKQFFVDGHEGVSDPIGLSGRRLEQEIMILHGEQSQIMNAVRVARNADVEVEDIAFSGLCASLAALTPEQRNSGVLLLNLGGGTTEYYAYANRAIAAAGVIAVGGDHLTNDIALGLKIPTARAERLKLEHGSAVPEPAQRHQPIPLPAESGFPERVVRLGDLQTIIHARMQETLRIVRKEMERQGLLERLGAGVVLTGGGALLRRLPDLVSREFNLPCGLGRPRGVSGLSVNFEPEFATAVGLLLYIERGGPRVGSGWNFRDLLRRVFGG